MLDYTCIFNILFYILCKTDIKGHYSYSIQYIKFNNSKTTRWILGELHSFDEVLSAKIIIKDNNYYLLWLYYVIRLRFNVRIFTREFLYHV